MIFLLMPVLVILLTVPLALLKFLIGADTFSFIIGAVAAFSFGGTDFDRSAALPDSVDFDDLAILTGLCLGGRFFSISS